MHLGLPSYLALKPTQIFCGTRVRWVQGKDIARISSRLFSATQVRQHLASVV